MPLPPVTPDPWEHLAGLDSLGKRRNGNSVSISNSVQAADSRHPPNASDAAVCARDGRDSFSEGSEGVRGGLTGGMEAGSSGASLEGGLVLFVFVGQLVKLSVRLPLTPTPCIGRSLRGMMCVFLMAESDLGKGCLDFIRAYVRVSMIAACIRSSYSIAWLVVEVWSRYAKHADGWNGW